MKKFLQKKSFLFGLIAMVAAAAFFVFFYNEIKGRDSIKIGLINDIHARRIKAEKGDLNLSSRTGLESFIIQMKESFRPDFVIQNGDAIEGTSRKGQISIDDFKLVSEYLARAGAPVYHVNGNHEMRGLTRGDWLKLTGKNKTYYYFDKNNFRVIILDGNENELLPNEKMNSNDPRGYLMTNEQFNWLEEKLKDAENFKKIVFIHYAPIIKDNERNLNQAQAAKLREIFSRHKVLAVFSGHTEILDYTVENGVAYFIIPGVRKSEDKKVRWLDSFAEINAGEQINVKLYYKRNRGETYKTLIIPSAEYEGIEK